MIYSVRGDLIKCTPDLAVVECGGVGYACRTTMQTAGRIMNEKNVLLYTYMSVREDAVELFGFATEEELNSFKMLTSVSGVGPKAGLAILSDLTPEKFALAVASGDSKAFTKVKGVGPKLAQRIVLELKDKISKEAELMGSNADVDFSFVGGKSNASEAISALIVLGYSQSDAASVVAKLDPNLPVEELIKLGLKGLARF